MDLQTSFLFALEKKRAKKKLITLLKFSDGGFTTNTRESLSNALRFYQNFFSAETCELGAMEQQSPYLAKEGKISLLHGEGCIKVHYQNALVTFCAMATKVFIAKRRSDVSTLCTLYCVPDTVFYCFCSCAELTLLGLGLTA